MTVRADLHRARALTLVAEGIHVTNDRVADLVVGLGKNVHRANVGHLVNRWYKRNGGACHVGNTV